MTKIDERIEELLAKHPSLTKLEAIKIVTEKNERKQKKRAEKTDRNSAKKLRSEASAPRASAVRPANWPTASIGESYENNDLQATWRSVRSRISSRNIGMNGEIERTAWNGDASAERCSAYGRNECDEWANEKTRRNGGMV